MTSGFKQVLLLVALLISLSAHAKIAKHPPKIYGPTKSSDTLWTIAVANKPRDVTVYQMMAAIYQANDHAFTSGNMHALKPKQKLLIPPAALVRKMDSTLAFDTINKLNIPVPNKKPVAKKAALPPPVQAADPNKRAKELNAMAEKNEQTEPRIEDLDSLLEKTIQIGRKPQEAKAKKPGAEHLSPEANALQQNLLNSQQALKNLEKEDAGLAKQLGDLNGEMTLLLATLQQSQ